MFSPRCREHQLLKVLSRFHCHWMVDSFCIVFTLFFVRVFIFSTLCSCKKTTTLCCCFSSHFITRFGGRLHSPGWRRNSCLGLVFLSRCGICRRTEECFYFQHRTMGTVWMGQYNGDHHPRQLTSHCGVVMSECKTTCVCVLQSKLCVRCSEWWMAGGGCDPGHWGHAGMVAWSVHALGSLHQSAICILFVFVLFFLHVCICSLHVVIH